MKSSGRPRKGSGRSRKGSEKAVEGQGKASKRQWKVKEGQGRWTFHPHPSAEASPSGETPSASPPAVQWPRPWVEYQCPPIIP